METSVIASFYRLCVLVGILGLILVVGWNQPLRYRFMSREEIYALENPAPETVTRGDWMWKDRQRALDRGPYNEKRNRTLDVFRD